VSDAFVITLDGPAASGKSTVGLGTARALRLGYFDTGLLYRALTWLALQHNVSPTDGGTLTRLIADLQISVDPVGHVYRGGRDITPELHGPVIDRAVSAVSAHSAVRHAMRPTQRALIRPPGLVMAGRDIGTVIVPEAPLKIWLSASPEVRARRRADQTGAEYQSVLDEMHRRDLYDRSRTVAPMTPAPDAVEIVTDDADPDAVIARIVELAHQRGAP
jgi:CMP/dCMP kinase